MAGEGRPLGGGEGEGAATKLFELDVNKRQERDKEGQDGEGSVLALGFAVLSPGNQPVFNPELMKATQRLRVNKKDMRKDAQKRKLQPESGYIVVLISGSVDQ
jgi:hypothetical protein